MIISMFSPVSAAEFSSGDDVAFSDTAQAEETELQKKPEEAFTDSDSETFLGNSGDLQLVCTTEPIIRPNEFTPIGNGCDALTAEEMIESADGELFTAGEEPESISQADINSINQAVDDIREAMVHRKNALEFTLTLSFEVEDWDAMTWNLLMAALEETGEPCEGDYLRWNFQSASTGYVLRDEGKGCYISYKPIQFYTTYEQEQKVSGAVDSVIAEMGFTDATTPYMKIKKIYDFICSTVKYDDAHVNDSSYLIQYTAYGAIIDQTAVCQGYALLLYRMLMEADVDNRMIPSVNHIWNLVYLRGCYYNVDATWDAEFAETGYQFFLKGRRSFEQTEDHIREENEMFGDYNSAEFLEEYPTSEEDYVIQEADTKNCSHIWNAWKEILKADCSSEGVKGRECTVCGMEEYELLEKTAHSWTYISNKNNTHTQKCTVCGTSKLEKCTFANHVCSKCKGQQILAKGKISKVSSAGYNKLQIAWEKTEGADGYCLEYLKGGTWKKITTTAKTSYTHTNSSNYPVATGRTCYYRVRAYYKRNGKITYGVYSDKKGGKALPARPELVKVFPKAYNQITIQWKKSAGASAYLIYRKNGTKWEQVGAAKGANTTSYTHVSSSKYPIVAGTSYTYTVRSYTSTGSTKGLYDSRGKAVKTSMGSTAMTLSKSSKGVKLSWKKADGATGYQIQRYANGKWSVIYKAGSSATAYLDKNIKKGTAYSYRIRAYRTYGKKVVYGNYSPKKTVTF